MTMWMAGAVAAVLAGFFYVANARGLQEGDDDRRTRLRYATAMVFTLCLVVLLGAGYLCEAENYKPGAATRGGGGARTGCASGGAASPAYGSASERADMMRYVLKSPPPF
jgi:hypothetical protein